MASAILGNLGLFKASGIFVPVETQSDRSGDGPPLTDPLAYLADELAGLSGLDEIDISDLAQFLQQAGDQALDSGHAGGSASGPFGSDLSDLFAPDPGPPGKARCDGPGISPAKLDDLLSELEELDRDPLRPAQGPRTRRIDHLISLERRESKLERLVNHIDQLETSGKKLVKTAAKLDQAGVHLENGVTPSVLRDRADEILELVDGRATAREGRAEELRDEAEELRALGGRKNLIRARFKVAVARFLDRTANALRDKADEKAEKLGKDANFLDRVMDKLGLSENSPPRKLRREGQKPQQRAERMKTFGEFKLHRAERLKGILGRILDRIRDRIDDLYGSASSIFDMEA